MGIHSDLSTEYELLSYIYAKTKCDEDVTAFGQKFVDSVGHDSIIYAFELFCVLEGLNYVIRSISSSLYEIHTCLKTFHMARYKPFMRQIKF